MKTPAHTLLTVARVSLRYSWRTVSLCSALLLSPLTALHAADAPKPDKRPPNVLFILTDDQGWSDAHFAGHPYVKTPNLDKFASQSTWVRQFYVASPVCSPSRAGFMTSQYPARLGINHVWGSPKTDKERCLPIRLDTSIPSVPKVFKQAGYATAHIGKWHLDDTKQGQEYGFDQYFSPPEQTDDPYFRAKSTALLVDNTIEFMKANRDRPFYGQLWTFLPHAPLNPTPEQLKVYESLAPKADDPAFGPWMQKYLANAKDLKSQMQVFCASLTDLTQLGRLFSALDELGLADNTIVFLSSDNGAEDYRVNNAVNAGVGNTGPLRARERSLYDGGLRTFGIMRCLPVDSHCSPGMARSD